MNSPTPSTQPATQRTAQEGGTFRDDQFDIALTYPAGWKINVDPDYSWKIVPTDGKTAASLSLEVPSLPPHIPGMIPIRSVVNGYTDDLKSSKGFIATTQTARTVPKASSKFVRTTWTENGQPMFEYALLLVHADHVYILRADGKLSDEPAIKPAFDAVSDSLHWLK